MNELTKTQEDILVRGQQLQAKTVDSILQFSLCVKELKETCKYGEFAKLAKEYWGLSKTKVAHFMTIAKNIHKLEKVKNALPASYSTLAEAAKCSEQDLINLSYTKITQKVLREDNFVKRNCAHKVQREQSKAKEKEEEVTSYTMTDKDFEDIEIKPNKQNNYTKNETVNQNTTIDRYIAMEIFGIFGAYRVEEWVIDTLYKKLVKTHHPDKGGNNDTMAKINEARKLLLEELVK